MKILVADDDPTLRMLLRELLQTVLAGCEVIETPDGQDAWQLLDSGSSVEICILDLKMPRLGGMELVARLRQDERFKQQKIIVCSGVNERATILEALSLGVEGYLLKPFAAEVLQDRVRKLIENPVTPTAVEPLLPVEDVLAKLGTSREAYLRQLNTFTKDVSNVITDLKGDWTPEVRRDSVIRLGWIDDSGRNLGAVQLAARAASLEQSVKKNEISARAAKTAALEVENKRVIAAAAKISPAPVPPSEIAAPAPAPFAVPATPAPRQPKAEKPGLTPEALDAALGLLSVGQK